MAVTEQVFCAEGVFFTSTERANPGSHPLVSDALKHLEAPQRLCTNITPRSYTIGSTLGNGSFGVVFKCGRHLSSQVVAVKVPLKTHDRSSWNEWSFLRSLKHKNIVELEEGYHNVMSDNMILVLKHANLRSLDSYCWTDSYDAKLHAREIFRQLTNGLDYLHSLNIAHCDFKPGNILVYGTPDRLEIKISDFGNARIIDANGFVDIYPTTKMYCAPEADGKNVVLARPAEMWSLGSILYYLLTEGSMLFWDTNKHYHDDKDINSDIHRMNGWINWPTKEEKPCMFCTSFAGKDLVHRLIDLDVERRPTLSEVMKHCWVRSMSHPRTMIERKKLAGQVVLGCESVIRPQVWWYRESWEDHRKKREVYKTAPEEQVEVPAVKPVLVCRNPDLSQTPQPQAARARIQWAKSPANVPKQNDRAELDDLENAFHKDEEEFKRIMCGAPKANPNAQIKWNDIEAMAYGIGGGKFTPRSPEFVGGGERRYIPVTPPMFES